MRLVCAGRDARTRQEARRGRGGGGAAPRAALYDRRAVNPLTLYVCKSAEGRERLCVSQVINVSWRLARVHPPPAHLRNN